MNIVIYNVNSFGGNYEYSKALYKAYKDHEDVSKVTVLSPIGDTGNGDVDFLLTDIPPINNKVFRKLYFVYRGIVNPLRFYRFLKKEEPSLVIFNDFDQTTSFLWYQWFLKLKRKHFFGVILHDPDRDKFLPTVGLSAFSMQKVMDIMDIAFVHGYLPNKSYYKKSIPVVEVPHGVYEQGKQSNDFLKEIEQQRNKPYLLGLLGNIRDEKNYDFIIDALVGLPDCQLLVAGSRSSSDVPIDAYKKKIVDLNLQARVIWTERFLSDEELSTAIQVCDVILLYYKVSFTSQSGILNLIAPYGKKLIITDTPSALQQVSALHNLGLLVAPNNREAFINGINKLTKMDANAFDDAWASYSESASWARHVDIAVDNFKKLKRI